MIKLNQKELLSIYNEYQQTGKDVIKANLKRYMDNSRMRSADVAAGTGIKLNTVYQCRRLGNDYKPEFMTTLSMCEVLGISITDVLEAV